MDLDRRTATVLVVTAVGIVGLVIAAGTLADPATTDEESESGLGGSLVPSSAGEVNDAGETIDFVPPGELLAVLGGLLLILVVGAALVDREVAGWLLYTLGSIGVILLLTAVFEKLAGRADTMPEIDSVLPNESNISAPGPPDDPVTTTTGMPIELIAGVLVVGIVAVVALIALSGDDPDPDSPEESDPSDDAAVAAVRQAAERANDRLAAGAALDNAIFRAWREMTDALEVGDPETTTPGEFAARARAAGMDPEAVDDLTGLFADVRYGDRPVTDERERRAREILETIAPDRQEGES